MTSPGLEPVLVIGIGNAYRRDDGVGPHVARRVAELNLPAVVVRTESGEGAALMETWQGYDHVILIDAVASGALPGTIHRLDAERTPLPREFFSYSTHAFSLAEAVELARVIGRLPPVLVTLGIEGATFAAGMGLSEPVQAAADQVLQRIRREIAGVRGIGTGDLRAAVVERGGASCTKCR